MKKIPVTRKKSVPEWLTSKTGIIDTVPAPWTPVKVKPAAFACWGREYAFDGRPLPARIVSRKENLLARPIELRVKINGQDLFWTACAVKTIERQRHGRFAKRIAIGRAGDLMLTSDITLFYDGTMRVDVRVDPLKPLTLDALTVSIPAQRSIVSLVWASLGPSGPASSVFTPDEIPDAGLSGPTTIPVLWLGSEERGLTMFCESDEGWDPGDDALALTKDKQTITAAIRIIRTPRQLNAPFSFSFGLQANPWRPAEKGCEHFRNYHYHSLYALTEKDLQALYDKGYRTMIFHSLWSHWHSYPETSFQKELFSLVRRCHRIGLKLLVYFGSEFSTGAPEWPDWGRRWIHQEPIGGYIPPRGPQYCAPHVCFNSEWPDFVLHGIDRLIRKYDLDGVYLDGWPEWGKSCANPLHPCGYPLPDGARKKTFPFWKCRELLERVYVTVKSIKPRGRISLHSNPGLGIVAQFGTDCFAGEGFAGNFRKVNLPFIRALHMGLEQWGVLSELIASADYDYGQAVGLLHGVLPRAGAYELGHKNIVDEPASIWKTQDAFGALKAQWHPYWRNGALVQSASDTVKVSLWNHPRRGALLVVSNLGTDETTGAVTVKWGKLGYKGQLEALDMLPCAKASVLEGSRLTAVLPAGQCRLIFVAPPTSALWPRMRQAREWIAGLNKMEQVKLDQWLLVGPFGAADPTPYLPPKAGSIEVPPDFRGLETAYPPESQPVDPKATFDVAGGKKCAWLPAIAKNGDLWMRPEVVREKWDVVYAYTRICFPTLVPSVPDNPVEIHLANHHAFKVWVNGQEVYSYGGAGTPRYGQKALYLNEHVIKAILHPGWNPVLVKLVTRQGADMTCKVTGPGGDALPPLLIQALDQ